jgi:hypothetical protein
MGVYQVTVDAKINSIVQQNNIGGQPAVITFSSALNPGDVLSIQCPLTTTWQSGGGPNTTNSDGVTVTLGSPIVIHWSSFNSAKPSPSLVSTLPYPNAANYSFGIGCAVGSLDMGNTFFPIGSSLTLTNLGNGTSNSPPTALWIFYWDINTLDNAGQIPFSATVTRRAS